ncbi:leashin-like [Vicia villosa]|uniref:leashin-like n=1 Tax=Vicia villosa TaxID=3911 RepID=UPI00273C67C1|nr:leashin-like [Vicia villosa]
MAAMSSDNRSVVFIDTNLDTHLALTISDHDTVSDFKKRIVLEHPLCFPKIGQIQINGIKVKRNGHFYHLSDSMIVKSAFSGYNKSWFLSVDVSALEDCRQNEQLFSHASLHRVDDNNAIVLPCNYKLQMLENKQNEREGVAVVSPCVSKHSASKADTNLKAGVNLFGNNDGEVPLAGSIPKTDDRSRLNNEVPSLHMECKVDGIDKGNKVDCNAYEDEPSVSVQSEMRKRKNKRKREDTVEGDKSKEEIASDHPRVSEVTGKKAVKDLEMAPSLNIECKVGESGEGNKDDCNRGEDVPSITAPSAKRRKKSKKKKEDAAGGDNSKEETPSDRPHVSEHTEKEAVKNLEVVPSLHIECEVDGLGEENKGVVPSTSEPSAKKKRKSKRKNKDTVGGSNSEINNGAVNNPVGCPSERASSFNIFQVPQSENKPDEKEEIPIDHTCVSPLTEKKAVKNLEMVPNSHIECGIDGFNKDIKDDSIVCEEATSKPSPSAKKKKKSKSKRQKEDDAGGDISKDNIASVDNPPDCPSERASNFNSFQVPQSENKQDEKEEIPIDRPCVSQPTENEAVKNLEMIPNSHIECEVDGSNSKDDSIVCEEGTSKPSASAKKKKKNKSKRQKEDAAGGDISKDNIVSVDNPPDCPSERASNFNSFQVPQSNNKQDEKEEIPFDRPCVLQLTEKKAVENLKMAPNSHIECDVDGSNKGNKNDSIVCEDGTSKPAPSAKKKKTNRRKKEETVQDDTLKENDASVVLPAQQDIVVLANSSENANKDSVVVPAQQDIVVPANPSENANKEEIKETDVLKEHQNTACNDNNTKSDVNVLSMNGASELMSPAKKKQKKRKKPPTHESKDIIMSKTNLDKMEIEKEACKESMQSTTKEAGNYKNQSDIELEVQLSNANEPKDLMKDNENVVVGHCNENEVGQTDRAAAGEVSKQNADMSGIKEPVKPVKEKKGIKKATSKGGGQILSKDNGHVDASESETAVTKSLKATICDPMPGNTETKENPLNKTEGEVLQQEKMQGIAPSVTDKRNDFSTENIDSPEQTKTKPNAQNMDEHVRVGKLSSPSDSGMSSIGEYRKPPNRASGRSRDLEKQRKHIPTSNAKLEEGLNKMVQNKARKASGNDAKRVASNSQQKKSLLDGAIFKDDSDSASEDEDKAYNSDASTRTPSDNSIPSDLDGYDSPGLDSQQNGSYDGKGLENDERSSLKSSLSGTTKLPIEQILRSSARYKKAKITASQLDESETPEFVPDSLAEM